MGGKSFNVYLKTFKNIYKSNIGYVQDYDREQRGQNWWPAKPTNIKFAMEVRKFEHA
jgi:hypothetical protein